MEGACTCWFDFACISLASAVVVVIVVVVAAAAVFLLFCLVLFHLLV